MIFLAKSLEKIPEKWIIFLQYYQDNYISVTFFIYTSILGPDVARVCKSSDALNRPRPCMILLINQINLKIYWVTEEIALRIL